VKRSNLKHSFLTDSWFTSDELQYQRSCNSKHAMMASNVTRLERNAQISPSFSLIKTRRDLTFVSPHRFRLSSTGLLLQASDRFRSLGITVVQSVSFGKGLWVFERLSSLALSWKLGCFHSTHRSNLRSGQIIGLVFTLACLQRTQSDTEPRVQMHSHSQPFDHHSIRGSTQSSCHL